MFLKLRFALLPLLVLVYACRRQPAGVWDDLLLCLPPHTVAVAGIHLDEVRRAAWYTTLPPTWLALLEPLHDATSVLAAYDGHDLLIAARGQFREAPAGATLLNPQLAVGGSAAVVRAATAQHSSGQSGAPQLAALAVPIVDQPVWAVLPKGAPLPLTGNAANLNRFLRLTDYTTLRATLSPEIAVTADGFCATPENAGRLEESVRAVVSLAAAAARDRDLARLLSTVTVNRDGARTTVRFSAPPAAIRKLLE